MLGLKFRMTFVVAFHTSDQEAPGNYDRATQSDDVPGSLFPLVPSGTGCCGGVCGWLGRETEGCGGDPRFGKLLGCLVRGGSAED